MALGRRKRNEGPVGRGAVVMGVMVGAAAMYFLDPQLGRTRRAGLVQRMGGIFRRASRKAEHQTRYHASRAEGIKERVARGGETIPEDDRTLEAKINSEVLGGSVYPKHKVKVTVEGGIVTLRGEADHPDQIAALEQEVGKVTGVIAVRNFLHMPGQPAPNKADAIDAGG
jgi:hypothetical protein